MAAVTAAVSRTVRVCTPCTEILIGPEDGRATGYRSRDTLRPTVPQHEAGILIEPPPSLACATGTTPAATSAAAPPEDPPVE